MHANSLRLMQLVVTDYFYDAWPKRVLDVGSLDVNGSYRSLLDFSPETYVGVDTRPGEGVDVVANVLDGLSMFTAEFDLIVCGQMLEHCTRPWHAVEIMATKLIPRGLLVLIAPWQWPHLKIPDNR